MLSCSLSAPPSNVITIIEPEVINPYTRILKAVIAIESNGDVNAFNEKELARGILQIRPIKLNQYFKETGIRLTSDDCFDAEKSIQVFMHFALKHDYRDIQSLSWEWNGKGKTNKYFGKLQKELLSL